jgi:hypothetical protein
VAEGCDGGSVTGLLLPSSAGAMPTINLAPYSDKFGRNSMYAVLAFLPSVHERRGLIVVAGSGADVCCGLGAALV